MKEILKRVPSIDGLTINHDGTIVYYKNKLKNILRRKNKNGKLYKYISLDNKSYSISKLVYETFIGPLPLRRNTIYLNNNQLDTHYLNLGPKPCIMASLFQMKKVPGFDELYINNNGTIITQNGYEISIRIQNDEKNKGKYYTVCINSGNEVKYTYVSILVAKAWLNWNGKGKVIHKDNNSCNNHYKNLIPLTLKQYGKRNIEILKNARKKRILFNSSIPKNDINKVKQRLLNGDALAIIAKDYNCSDMSIVRFKKRHFTKKEIDQINSNKGINTKHTPKNIIEMIVQNLKEGKKQIDLANKYNLSPTVICRINRLFIRNSIKNK